METRDQTELFLLNSALQTTAAASILVHRREPDRSREHQPQHVSTRGQVRLSSPRRSSSLVMKPPLQLEIAWQPARRPAAILPDASIHITGYQVIAGSFQVSAPASATSVIAPAEYYQPLPVVRGGFRGPGHRRERLRGQAQRIGLVGPHGRRSFVKP